MRVALVAFLFAVLPALTVAQMQPDQVDASILQNAKPNTLHISNAAGGGVLGKRSSGGLLGIDSLVNWSSYFYLPGFFSDQIFGLPVGPQFTWQYTMVGHAPFGMGNDSDWQGETTWINAPIVPVNLDLRNFDGSPRFVNGQRLYSIATPYVTPVVKSPVFAKTFYGSSGPATQFTDAIQRAEFFNRADSQWHTLLRPLVKTARTMTLIRGTYRFALNPDGSCCPFVLIDINAFVNALFPAVPTDTSTVIGAAENAGDIHTRDLSTFLFPNAYLYFNGDPGQCCVLGFHSYDLEPGGPTNGFRERRYVVNYSSWISPGLFGDAFTDITALSHEVAETFNDPFVNNATPWWLAPNGVCQDNLETGDVIEGLPHATFPITMNGFTYHPQNEALVQWFASETPSSAISDAYSYPDTTVLTSASVSLTPGCTGPFSFPPGK
jgi:hypothetical protein